MMWLVAITTFLIVVAILLIVVGWIWKISINKYDYVQLQRDYTRASRERDDLRVELSHLNARMKSKKEFINYAYESEIKRLNEEITRKELLLAQKWCNGTSEKLSDKEKQNEADSNSV